MQLSLLVHVVAARSILPRHTAWSDDASCQSSCRSRNDGGPRSAARRHLRAKTPGDPDDRGLLEIDFTCCRERDVCRRPKAHMVSFNNVLPGIKRSSSGLRSSPIPYCTCPYRSHVPSITIGSGEPMGARLSKGATDPAQRVAERLVGADVQPAPNSTLEGPEPASPQSRRLVRSGSSSRGAPRCTSRTWR